MDYITYPVSRKAFRAKACVDWLDIAIHISRPTQFQHLQDCFEKAGCGKLHVKALEERSGGVAENFVIRIHDELANDYAALSAKLNKVAKDYPIVGEPTITAIEVACDFWHKGPPALFIRDTFAMTYRLQSSLYASGTKPRQFDPELGERGEVRFMDSEGARLNPAGTFYIGHETDNLMWKAYFKCVDKKKSLPQFKWRARVEVTIQGAGMQSIGIRNLSDLSGFKFDRLARLFRFRRPIDPIALANGDLFKLTAIRANRRINDATPARGIHSFDAIGRKGYRWRNKLRAESKHIEPDYELQDAVKGALKRLSV